MSSYFSTLDYEDKIVIEGDCFGEPKNEFYALLCLKEGMCHLYHEVDQRERNIANNSGLGKNCIMFSFGNLPELKQFPRMYLTCVFQWYSISAVQYVRTVASIALKNGKISEKPKEYSERIIPEVVAYRDKVAAHYAWNSRNNYDNDAERFVSIIPQLALKNNKLYTSSVEAEFNHKGKVSSSKALKPWSLTEIHQRLQNRYWRSEKDSEEMLEE